MIRKLIPVVAATAALSVAVVAGLSQPASGAFVATGMSATDLAGVAEALVGEISEAMASESELTENSGDISRAGEVLAAVANAVATAEGEAKWKGGALSIRDSAIQFAKVAKGKNYGASLKELKNLQAMIEGGGNKGEQAAMKSLEIVSLHHVMEEVQGRYSPLRRSLRSESRLKGAQKKVTNDTMVLAFLATVIKEDTGSAKAAGQPQDAFEKHCVEMMESAIAVSKAAATGDVKKAGDARKLLGASCTACHEVYRKEE